MRNYGKLLLVFCGSMLLCGCVEMTGSLRPQGYVPQIISGRSFPTKFYVEKIEEDETYSDCATWKKFDTVSLRAELCKTWPEIFTNRKYNALQVKFLFEVQDTVKEEYDFISFSSVFFSMLTLGFSPARINYSQDIKLKVIVENETIEHDYILRRTGHWNLGILGFFGTRHLLNPGDDQLFKVTTGGIDKLTQSLVLNEAKRKDFLSLLVSELYRYPEDTLLKIYLSRKSRKTEFLE